MQQQQREQRALLASTERDHAALVEDLERAEDAELHARRISQGSHAEPTAGARRRPTTAAVPPPRHRPATDPGDHRPRCRSPTTTTGRATEAIAHNKEAVMGQAIPAQHPAVVLRSRYTQLRTLLAVAMIAVVGLTVAVVILAGEHGSRTTATSAAAG